MDAESVKPNQKTKLTLEDFIYKLDTSLTLSSLRRGFIMTLPFLLLGAISLVFLSIPLPWYSDFIKSVCGGHIYEALKWIYNATFSILSLLFILCIGYSFGMQVSQKVPSFYPLCALSCYLIITAEDLNAISVDVFSSQWTFGAIVVTLLSCNFLYLLMKGFNKLYYNQYKESIDSDFQNTLVLIFPFFISIGVFLLIKMLSVTLFYNTDLQNIFSIGLNSLFSLTGNGFWGALLFVFLDGVLSVFGIPSGNALSPVLMNSFYPPLMANITAASQNAAPQYIFNLTFFDSFVFLGGAGCTLCLLFALLIGLNRSSSKRICAVSFVPSLFNISEVMVYGLPVILNPILLLPFIFVPIVSFLISAFAMYIGFVPYVTQYTSWATPVLFNGYISTGSWRGVVLQIICLIVGILIYIPFVKRSEKYYQMALKRNFAELTTAVQNGESLGRTFSTVTSSKRTRNTVQLIKNDLRFALKHKNLQLFYQPQITSDGKLYGVEALLRWKHPIVGYVYPPLIIDTAIEDNLIDTLGLRIIELACRTLQRLSKNTSEPMHLSVNISPVQLENEAFCRSVKSIISKYDFGNNQLCFEITEQIALSGTQVISLRMNELRKMGIPFHMDDFGMGHSSMTYLQNSEFSAVKLDGNLIKQMLENTRAQNIITGINQMSHGLNYDVIAEYVETDKQKDALKNMGCQIYQGFLYSQALPLDKLEEYLSQKGLFTLSGSDYHDEDLYL